MIRKLISGIDWFTAKLGNVIALSSHLLVLVICADVLMRYLFNTSKIWVIEIEVYLFAFLFLLGGSYTALYDAHVRVDVYYEKLSPRGQAITDLIGGLVLLLPWSILLTCLTYEYMMVSYIMGEKSAQPGGLPYVFLLKGIMAFGFFVLTIQGISQILKAVLFLTGTSDTYLLTPTQNRD